MINYLSDSDYISDPGSGLKCGQLDHHVGDAVPLYDSAECLSSYGDFMIIIP